MERNITARDATFPVKQDLATAQLCTNQTMQSDAVDHVGHTELSVVIVLLVIMSIVGTAGNAIVMYVFSKKRDKQVSTLFILVMAFVDFTTCLIVMPYTIYMEYIEFKIKYDVLCKVYQFLITSNIPFSALVMAAIAIDRYLCICHPFCRALTVARAKVTTACLAALSIAIGIIVSMMYSVYHLQTPSCNQALQNHADENISSSVTETSPMFKLNTISYTKGFEASNEIIYTVRKKENGTKMPGPSESNGKIYTYTGQCDPYDRILTGTFQWYYQKLYTALFVLCLAIVSVLYCLIYRSVLRRRAMRAKQKSKALLVVQSADAVTKSSPTLLTVVENGDAKNNEESPPESTAVNDESPLNGSSDEPVRNGHRQTKSKTKNSSIRKAKKQKTSKKDRLLMANLKTAAMLFVVTVVFIVTFAPAFLMALDFLPYNIVVFYMYFANNVANPVIYSFMNKNFRDDLRKLFCRNR